jgi:hypothetical protein
LPQTRIEHHRPRPLRAVSWNAHRPFMLAGLLMQTAGLACLAVIARRHTPFLEAVVSAGPPVTDQAARNGG